MNILYIDHYAGSPEHGMEYRPWYMASSFQAKGHPTTVVAASHSHLRTKPFGAPGRDGMIDVLGVPYHIIKTPSYHGNGAGRVANILAFCAALRVQARALARRHRPDVVIASSTYPLDAYGARRIARHAHTGFVFETHDLWPLSPMEIGGLSAKHPFIRLLQRGEDFVCQNADAVVSVLPGAMDHYKTRGLHPDRYTVVPNGVYLEDQTREHAPLPETLAATLAQERRAGRFILGYAGGLNDSNAMDRLIEAATLFQDEAISVVIVGQGRCREALERMVRERHLRHVFLFAPIAKTSVPTFLAAIDAGYMGFQASDLLRFGSSPNKIFDYMLASRPIVMTYEYAHNLVEQAQCGLSTAMRDPAAIARTIKTMAALPPEDRAAMGARGRAYVLAHHTYDHLADRFLATLSRVAQAYGRLGAAKESLR